MAAFMVALVMGEEPVKDSGTALVAAVDQKTWDFIKSQLEVVEPWAQIPSKVKKLEEEVRHVLTDYATKHDLRTVQDQLNDLKALESKNNNEVVSRVAAIEALDIDKVRTQIRQSVEDLKQDTLNSIKRMTNDIIANHKKNQADIETEKQVAANALALDKKLLLKEIAKKHEAAMNKLNTLEEQMNRRLDSLTPKGMRATLANPDDTKANPDTSAEIMVATGTGSDLPVNGWKFGFLLLTAFNLGGLSTFAYMKNKNSVRIPLLP